MLYVCFSLANTNLTVHRHTDTQTRLTGAHVFAVSPSAGRIVYCGCGSTTLPRSAAGTPCMFMTETPSIPHCWLPSGTVWRLCVGVSFCVCWAWWSPDG